LGRPRGELNTKTPVASIDMTKDLCCPLLGLLGTDPTFGDKR